MSKDGKKKSVGKTVAIVIASLLGITILAAGLYFNYMFGKINIVPPDKTFTLIPETPNPIVNGKDPYATDPVRYPDAPKYSRSAPYDKNIINVLLIGVDRRDPNETGRSDSMIIATLDKVHKKVKLTSIMRDTYVFIPKGYQNNKINASYHYGNAPLLLETINSNFNLKLSKYVIVDFNMFQKIVDRIGGIDVNLDKVEVNYLKLHKEFGSAVNKLKVGSNHLNGRLALEYTRIRHVGNGDFERTQRQRVILSAIFQKGMKTDVLTLNSMMLDVLPMVTTNLSQNEIVGLLTSALTMGTRDVQQFRVPDDKTFENDNIRGMAVLVPDLQVNTDRIRKFIYED